MVCVLVKIEFVYTNSNFGFRIPERSEGNERGKARDEALPKFWVVCPGSATRLRRPGGLRG